MKITITCSEHDNAPVIPASDELHWMGHNFAYELDEGDLYCTGGVGSHKFVYTVTFE
jgi:hypothetical protein